MLRNDGKIEKLVSGYLLGKEEKFAKRGELTNFKENLLTSDRNFAFFVSNLFIFSFGKF